METKKAPKRDPKRYKDSMLGVTLAAGEGQVRDDERAKQTFFEAIGLMDERPYIGLDAKETINQIRDNAGITLKDMGVSMGLQALNHRERPRQLIDQAAWLNAKNIPGNARRLGEILKPLMQMKIEKGVITGDDFTKTPLLDNRLEAGRTQQLLEHNDTLKLQLLEKLGLPVSAMNSYRGLSPAQMTLHFCKLIHYHYDIAQDDIAKQINPDWNTQLYARIHGIAKLDADFMQQFAAAVKPYLEQGVREGWLDENFAERPFEAILAEKLPSIASRLEGKAGFDALRACIAISGLPQYAIGPMLGRENNWISVGLNPNSRVHLQSKDIADIAVAIAPYIQGQKMWEGVLETNNSDHLAKHEVLKKYLLAGIEKTAGKKLHQLRQVARNHPTIGPLIRDIRESFSALKIHQNNFGEIQQHEISTIESNCFKINCMDNQGNISDGYRRKFDVIARTLGEVYKTQSPTLNGRRNGTWQKGVGEPTAKAGRSVS